MLKKASLSVASLAVLTACASCTTLPDDSAQGNAQLAPVTVDNATDVTVPHKRVVYNLKFADGTEAASVAELKKVHFGFDSSALSSKDQERLRMLAEVIKVEKPSKIVIEGHCDERGTREYNLALGDRRAVSVMKYLVGLGVDASKLSTVSYGKERPSNMAHTPAAWAENRRSEIIFK